MCKLRRITYKLIISPLGFTQFECDLHINNIHKNKIHSYSNVIKLFSSFFFFGRLLRPLPTPYFFHMSCYFNYTYLHYIRIYCSNLQPNLYMYVCMYVGLYGCMYVSMKKMYVGMYVGM